MRNHIKKYFDHNLIIYLQNSSNFRIIFGTYHF